MRSDDDGEALGEGPWRFLVERVAVWDPDAWEQLYRCTYPQLFAVARRRLGSDAAADDAVSETMLRAIDGIGRFSWQGGGIEAWLFGILRNVILEAKRREGRIEPVPAPPEPTQLAGGDPVATLVENDQRIEVRAAFQRLSAEDRELLELRVVAKLSADGVAAAMGTTAGAIRTAQSRALHRLRAHYESITHEH